MHTLTTLRDAIVITVSFTREVFALRLLVLPKSHITLERSSEHKLGRWRPPPALHCHGRRGPAPRRAAAGVTEFPKVSSFTEHRKSHRLQEHCASASEGGSRPGVWSSPRQVHSRPIPPTDHPRGSDN
ncbi:hypothetical protein E2C01_062734 [Portunus trituberculatus]|uniref:Uncharacterized protein n=1 Tax=Portunus trituberculatus TaxID=210409 RepID=A0A5B7HBW5_PORTR|nr:hypothetical protein [Portunus trituberculatus]